jgi:putative solute:sodium symporter small subunit
MRSPQAGNTLPITGGMQMQLTEKAAAYWKANGRRLIGCLIVWFIVSFGFGILLAQPLNSISLGGYPLGFWFAQQGSIYTFIGLIFFYVWKMNKIDHEFDVHEE